MRTVADVLDRAADLLEQDGWQQHDYGPTDPEVRAPRCVEGALEAVATNTQLLVAARLALVGDRTLVVVARWNDDESRSADEVISTLRRRAARKREGTA